MRSSSNLYNNNNNSRSRSNCNPVATVVEED
jgi:hypothetical protein